MSIPGDGESIDLLPIATTQRCMLFGFGAATLTMTVVQIPIRC